MFAIYTDRFEVFILHCPFTFFLAIVVAKQKMVLLYIHGVVPEMIWVLHFLGVQKRDLIHENLESLGW